MDDLLREFLTEAGEHLDTVDVELVRFEQEPTDQHILRNIFRLVHTIKGTCGFLGLPRLEALTHAAETLMEQLRDGAPVTSEAVTLILVTVDRIKAILVELERLREEPPGSDRDLIAALERASGADGTAEADDLDLVDLEDDGSEEAARERLAAEGARLVPALVPSGPMRKPQTIRVGVEAVERLMTMVSELVLTRNQLLDLSKRTDVGHPFKAPLQRLSRVTAELQESVMKTRMQPIGAAWAKLPRVIRDLSADLGKEIDLVMRGAETELDRQVLEIIRDPLTHMVRNAADHGIETPHERRAAGKPERGTIRLHAFHEGGTIRIELSDDGRGLDLDAIRQRAVDTGLIGIADASRMDDDQTAELIFHAGLTTSHAITSVSGRGVGMDVVRTNVDLIGGTVEISSEPGRGTLFTFKIPLTLAIIAALVVELGGQRFAIPQISVVEVLRTGPGSPHVIERVNEACLLRVRDALLPIAEGAHMLGLQPRAELGSPGRFARDAGFVVVVEVGRMRFGLLVDGVLETEEIVVKPLSTKLEDLPVFSGTTILGDGAVALILDPSGMGRRLGAEAQRNATPVMLAPAAPVETTTLLVFRGLAGALKAIPLSLVSRLEELDGSEITWTGDQPVIPYRGRLMTLFPVDGAATIRTSGPQPAIILSDGRRSIGLLVGEIVDVVEEAVQVDLLPARPDLIGAAMVRGRATELVDIAPFLHLIDGDASWADRDPVAGPPSTVLLVDDRAFFRDMLSPVLKAAGFRVRTAKDAEEALHIMAVETIDTLVTDLDLPVRTGLELIEDLRRRSKTAELTVVALTSDPLPDDMRRARELGVFDVVAKFDRAGLLAALAEANARERRAA